MKRAIVLVAVVLLLASCRTGKPKEPERVHMDIVELTGLSPSQPPGPFDVQLGIEVQNLSNEPVTIKRVEVAEIGPGAWVLRPSANRPFLFDTVVAPGRAETVTFWAHAYAVGVRGSNQESEPVTLRATVFFNAPSGPFHDITQQIIDQH
ncbi:MAG TPA: hypothetical protein VH087_19535 [Thermoanaerobaculia bacterium]|jgi:hypothetical protein|nr:hypothetical protein [Thermoanaerobaculia bacterium]